MKNNKTKAFLLRYCGFVVNSPYYVKLRNLQRSLRYYAKFRFGKVKHEDTFYFIIDPHRVHPGLADRLKAIVSAYNEAKSKGLRFKLIFKVPFVLEEYLQPASESCDWRADYSEPEYIIGKTHFVKEYTGWSIPVEKGHQYHCYFYAGNDLPEQFENTGWKWYDLFTELFAPTETITNAVEAVGLEPRTYCAVHLRFVNALENFEVGYSNGLQTEEEKQNLIARCKKAISDIAAKTGQKVVVFSDSKRFLSSLDDLPVIVLDSKDIGHISMESTDMSVAVTKTFLDMYVISRASKVYKINAPELYLYSRFALCAARMGNAKFEEVDV